MKLSFMELAYPLVLDKLVKKQLVKQFDQGYVKKVLSNVHLLYKQILRRAPDWGGCRNIFMKNIYMGSYIIAVYQATKDKISLTDLNGILVDCLNNFSLLKKAMKGRDLSSAEYREKLKKAAVWSQQNRYQYPGNWLLCVPDHRKPNGVYYEFTQCGLCTLCRQEGVPELMPLLCNTDYITIGFAGCKLSRTKTLANGDSCCDFWIQANQ